MPTAQQDAAATILAHLVSLRGGAPFLSSADARLLLGWLNQGVPVPLLLHALEVAAEKRRKKRLRTPLSLAAAKGAVKQWKGGTRKTPTPVQGAMAPLVLALRKSGEPAYRPVMDQLSALEGEGEDLVAQALAISRAFFERAWETADRAALMDQAADELSLLKDTVPPPRFAQLCDEVARDLLRQRHPLLSATSIWDTVEG